MNSTSQKDSFERDNLSLAVHALDSIIDVIEARLSNPKNWSEDHLKELDEAYAALTKAKHTIWKLGA